jgi:hypothetical protein
VHEVRAADFERAAASARSSALEWLDSARNHAKYANSAGQYDELEQYLRKIKRW